jgi:hypothetical protein
MIHFKFLKPIANNQIPYFDEAWNEKKGKHKLDKVFSILISKFNEEFYIEK